MRSTLSTLILSDTGEGKTTQIGLMALWHFKRTGGYVDPAIKKAVGGERTVLYTADFGGWAVVQPLIDLGIIYLVDLTQMNLTFDWLDKIAGCKVPAAVWDGPGAGPGWVDAPTGTGTLPKVGHFAFDSGTTYAHLLMQNLTNGELNIGGQAGMSFVQGDMVFKTNTQAHYGIVQQAVLKAVAKSQVSTNGLVTWTFRLRRSESEVGAMIIGPQIAGGALTPEMPAWFNYTFRLVKETPFGSPSKVVLYADHHVDKLNPNAKILANARVPVGATPPPLVQDPAHVPQMIESLEKAALVAIESIIKACPPPAVSTADL